MRFLIQFVAIFLFAGVLVPIFWVATRFVTPGSLVANSVISAEPPSFLGHLGEGLEISAFVDFGMWFTALWGAHFLWVEFRRQIHKGGPSIHRVSPARKADLMISSVGCALPVAFYVLIGLALLFNRGFLPESNFSLALMIALSLVASSAAILGLFVLAVRFWSRTPAT